MAANTTRRISLENYTKQVTKAQCYAKLHAAANSDCMILHVATDGQAGIQVKRECSSDARAVAKSIPSGTPNRRKLILSELKARNMLS